MHQCTICFFHLRHRILSYYILYYIYYYNNIYNISMTLPIFGFTFQKSLCCTGALVHTNISTVSFGILLTYLYLCNQVSKEVE